MAGDNKATRQVSDPSASDPSETRYHTSCIASLKVIERASSESLPTVPVLVVRTDRELIEPDVNLLAVRGIQVEALRLEQARPLVGLHRD